MAEVARISEMRASILLASGSAAQVLSGLVVSKLLAVRGGAETVGVQGLYMSLLTLAVLLLGCSVGQALVTSRHRSEEGEPYLQTNRRFVVVRWYRSIAMLSFLPVACLMYTRGERLLGIPISLRDALFAGIAVGGLLIQSGELAVLTEARKPVIIARTLAFGSVAAAGAACTVILLAGPEAVVPALSMSAVVQGLLTTFARKMSVARNVKPTGTVRGLGMLLREGGPLTLCLMIGSGVQATVPFIVQAVGTTSEVGLYRAVSALTVGCAGLLLVGLARDYFPRVAVVPAWDLSRTVERQQRVLLTVAYPLMIVGIVSAEPLLRLVYTQEFVQAEGLFGLQLIGDLVRLVGFCFAYAVMGRLGGGAYFRLEVLGGICILFFSVAGMLSMSLPGLGLGYCMAYGVYLLAAGSVCRSRLAITISVRTVVLLGCACCVLLILVATSGHQPLQLATAAVGISPTILKCARWVGRHAAGSSSSRRQIG